MPMTSADLVIGNRVVITTPSSGRPSAPMFICSVENGRVVLGTSTLKSRWWLLVGYVLQNGTVVNIQQRPNQPKPKRSAVERSHFSPTAPTESEISRVMRELGSRGGKIGGIRRAAILTPERRREIALAAARKRWEYKPSPPPAA